MMFFDRKPWLALLVSLLAGCSSSTDGSSTATPCYVNGVCVDSAECQCGPRCNATGPWSAPGTDTSGTTPSGDQLCRSIALDANLGSSDFNTGAVNYRGSMCFGLAYGSAPSCPGVAADPLDPASAIPPNYDCTVAGAAYSLVWNGSSGSVEESAFGQDVARINQATDDLNAYSLVWGQGQSGHCTTTEGSATLCFSTAPEPNLCF